ncbi:bifunctional glycosyltransferase/CDP-glycerol:glycerophosphate glycerophosphotransferase [Brevibacterium marinum]|uniref:CDP-glycerol glycerophosphotransferase (TagB/SpsB family) n=1 Tax=Brevibacterium marinum TaxID=418643 RepID=A0A846RVS2_9MICO|nr:CDP-glycerol glycerophosphotransferase family protein [Brevibacterium marinum]NJC55018.1 CDP-glycerol glycerophosphotransferase (TagB/SpsB family) [Brevibacterium marinum]
MIDKKFAVVSAVYNVSRYLDDFLSSLDRQTFDHSLIEIILVDDGSTDDSLDQLNEWAAATDFAVTMLMKTNGGQASARNLGLGSVTAEWVTFADPDDTLAEDYFEAVDASLNSHANAEMVICHLVDNFEATDEVKDSHPLRHRFRGGDQLVDVDRFPEYIHLHASSAFFRTAKVNDLGLRFDERLRPTFEDGHFVQKYLLMLPKRLVSVVDSAKYFYRRRADKSSTLQTSATDPGKYTTVLEFGCLQLLEQAAPEIPLWLQYVIIYELTWTLRAEEAMYSATSSLESAVVARFHELVGRIRGYLSSEAIESFPLVKRSTTQFEALAHGYVQENWRWQSVVVDSLDEDRRLVELRYHYTGTRPREVTRFRGKPIEPLAAKTRDFTYLRRALIHERILWVPADGTVEILLDGTPVPVTFGWPKPRQFSVRPAQVQAQRGSMQKQKSKARRPKPRKRSAKFSARDSFVPSMARAAPIRRMFADAWVLMDRDVNANDNAEHLFRYLRRRRRDINAWFVVEKNSPDWSRLRNEGYKRLIPYGSTLWKALCLNARYIVSSHADAYVYSPFVLSNGERPRWKFVFLQHGVTQNNISRWLNGKNIAGMVTSTVDEFASVAGDHSPYKLSAKDVSLTGMPRHDVLAKKASSYALDERSVITVMPTWRQFLVGEAIGRGNRRLPNYGFFESEFLRRWLDVLESPELQRMAEEHEYRIMFMPHPNLEDYLPGLTLPDHVEVRSFAETNVQDVIAQSAVVVTDYSSIAFDAAIVHRPVVYYQFDRERVFGGDHLTKPGYFSYDRAGFGPVALEHDQVLEALHMTLGHGKEPAPEYMRRIERTFVTPGHACSRVTEMIEELDHPVCIGDHRPTPKAPEIQYTN